MDNLKNTPVLEQRNIETRFGDVMGWLKKGGAAARAGWNGKGMFVYLVPAASYPAQTSVAKALFGENGLVPYNAYLALKGVDGKISTWAPSGNDSMADDWILYQVTPDTTMQRPDPVAAAEPAKPQSSPGRRIDALEMALRTHGLNSHQEVIDAAKAYEAYVKGD